MAGLKETPASISRVGWERAMVLGLLSADCRPEARPPLGRAHESELFEKALRPEVLGMGADGEKGAAPPSGFIERRFDQTSANPRVPRPLDHEQVVEIDAALPGLGSVHPAQDRVAKQRRPPVRDEGGNPRDRAEEVSFESGQAGVWLIAVVACELAHHLQDGGHVRLSGFADQRCGHVTVGSCSSKAGHRPCPPPLGEGLPPGPASPSF
jgi:hypothetical protein